MAERQLQPPEDVTAAARHLVSTTGAGIDRDRLAWIAQGGQVGRPTLLALLASGVTGRVGAWATRTYRGMVDREQDSEIRALTAAAVEDDGRYFGILTDTRDVITAVIRASAADGLHRWGPEGWVPVPEDMAPVGFPYRELSGDLLADAVTACAAGQALMLRPTTPRAFLSRKVPLTASAAQLDGVYAAVDEADTTAVVQLLRRDGAHNYVRTGGGWAYDDDDLLPYLVASGAPLALVPDVDLPPLLRAFDDHEAVFPLLADATEPTGPQAAGLAVKAIEPAGRVLMLQRALDPDDPAGGDWEFPGGGLEPGEDPYAAACREWSEETGMPVPDGTVTGGWTSPDGVYQGYVLEVPDEDALDLHSDRGQVTNPDDPDGDAVESIAWTDPEDLPGHPGVRAELQRDMPIVMPALTGQPPAITGDNEALTAAHSYPGQRYRHGWIPVAGFNPGAYHQRRHPSGGHVEIGARGGQGIKSIGEVHNRPAGGFTAKHMYKGESHETHHATEGEARSAVIRGHEAHQAEHGPADAGEAFRMSGSDLRKHAGNGSTVAQTELDRRAAKKAGNAASPKTEPEPLKPAAAKPPVAVPKLDARETRQEQHRASNMLQTGGRESVPRGQFTREMERRDQPGSGEHALARLKKSGHVEERDGNVVSTPKMQATRDQRGWLGQTEKPEPPKTEPAAEAHPLSRGGNLTARQQRQVTEPKAPEPPKATEPAPAAKAELTEANRRAAAAQARDMTPEELHAQNRGDLNEGDQVSMRVGGRNATGTVQGFDSHGRPQVHIPGHGTVVRSADQMTRKAPAAPRDTGLGIPEKGVTTRTGVDDRGRPITFTGHTTAQSRATSKTHGPGTVYAMHNGSAEGGGLDATANGSVFVPDNPHAGGKAEAPAAGPVKTETPPAASGGEGKRVQVTHSGDGTLLDIDRNDTEARDAAKAAGFKWSRNLGSWYLPRNWSESTRRLKVRQLRRQLGDEHVHIEDAGHGVSTTAAEREAARREAATERAGRMDERAARHTAEAQSRFDRAHQIAEGIPMGQPILVGHHSEGRHRRDLARIESNSRKGIEAHDKAEAAERSAENARRTAEGDSPLARQRRVDRNEAQARKIDRMLQEHDIAQKARAANPESFERNRHMFRPLSPGYHAQLTARRAQLADEIEHDKAQIEQSGHKAITAGDLSPGDVVKYRGRWHPVKKVNKTTVSVPSGYSWDDKLPINQISEHRTLGSHPDDAIRKAAAEEKDDKLRGVYEGEARRRGLTPGSAPQVQYGKGESRGSEQVKR